MYTQKHVIPLIFKNKIKILNVSQGDMKHLYAYTFKAN